MAFLQLDQVRTEPSNAALPDRRAVLDAPGDAQPGIGGDREAGEGCLEGFELVGEGDDIDLGGYSESWGYAGTHNPPSCACSRGFSRTDSLQPIALPMWIGYNLTEGSLHECN